MRALSLLCGALALLGVARAQPKTEGEICSADNDCNVLSGNPKFTTGSCSPSALDANSYCCAENQEPCGDSAATACFTCGIPDESDTDGGCQNRCTATPCFGSGTQFDSVCTLDCANRVKALVNGRTCEFFTNSGNGAFCDNTGACVPVSTAACTTASAAESSISCGSAGCLRSNALCTEGGAAPADVNALCFTGLNGNEGTCPNDEVCNASGTCVKRVDGADCSDCADGSCCASSNCVDGFCCTSSDCGDCSKCTGTGGVCEPVCTDSVNGACEDVDAFCSAVSCNSIVIGLTGAQCEFHTTDGNDKAFCLANMGACATAADRATICPLNGGYSRDNVACGDDECLQTGVCSPGDPISASPTDLTQVNNLCVTDGSATCNTDSTCGANGNCLLPDGSSCTMSDGSECSSSICDTGAGVCCDQDCGPCGQCNPSGTGCVHTCTNPAGCSQPLCGEVQIQCQDYYAGFVSPGVCHTYDAPSAAVRLCLPNDPQCATATSRTLCSELGIATSARITCGDPECEDSSLCVEGTGPASGPSPPVSEACFTSDPGACTGGQVCNGAAQCATPLKADGEACGAGTECNTGICGSPLGYCCPETCGACATCTSGTCEPRCTAATLSSGGGCSGNDPSETGTPYQQGCPAVPCGDVAVGFETGPSGGCRYFTADAPTGACQLNAENCITAASVGVCTDLSAPTAIEHTCRDAACQIASSCVAGAAYSTGQNANVFCNIGNSCGSGQPSTCSPNGECLLDNGETCTNADGSECLSGNCVPAAGGTRVCCNEACTAECSECSSGTCTPCSVTSPNGCPVTPNAQLASCGALDCTDIVRGYNGAGECRKYTGVNSQAKCKSQADGNSCADTIATDFAYCSATTDFTVPSGQRGCISASCQRATACQPGAPAADHDTIAELCHTDNTQNCAAGRSCSVGGACLKNNGQTCSGSAECINTCEGDSNRCCPQDCDDICFNCDNGATCEPSCTQANGCAPRNSKSCPGTLPCNNVVKGWTGASCEVFNQSPPNVCTQQSDMEFAGGCTASGPSRAFFYCDIYSSATVRNTCTQGDGSSTGPCACADDRCRRLDRCILGDAQPTAISQICLQSGPGTCGTGRECNIDGDCKISNGEACTASPDCASGLCDKGFCCTAACPDCQTCEGSPTGSCGSVCSAANGCLPPSGECVGQTIACSGIIAGWTGSTCERYSQNPTALCDQNGLCSTSTSLCVNHPNAGSLSRATTYACDDGCANFAGSACEPGDPSSANNQAIEVCFTTGGSCSATDATCNLEGQCQVPGGSCDDNNDCTTATPHCVGVTNPPGRRFCCDDSGWTHICQTCADNTKAWLCNDQQGCPEPVECGLVNIPCTNRVRGWDGPTRTCQRWKRDYPGVCRFEGLCTGDSPVASDARYCEVSALDATGGNLVLNTDYEALFVCGDARCHIPNSCEPTDTPTTIGDVCDIDGNNRRGCPSGQVCAGTNGICLREDGQTCSNDNQCLNNFCRDGYCCNENCGPECRRCNLSGREGVCSDNDGVDCTSSTTNCPALLAGFQNTVECHVYSATTSGVCQTGNCVDKDCGDAGVPSTATQTCADSRCVRSGSCNEDTPSAAVNSLDDVCFVSETRGACPSINCPLRLKGWSASEPNVCLIFGSVAVTGECDGTADCVAPNNVQSMRDFCPAAGAEHLRCGDVECIESCDEGQLASNFPNVADVCNTNNDDTDCASIDCRGIVKGWNGPVCERYDFQRAGYCDASGACVDDKSQCQNHGTLTAVQAGAAVCGENNCRDLSACQEGTQSSLSDSQAEVCLQNELSSRCSGFTCTNRIHDLSGAECRGYTINSAGYCNAGSSCVTQCINAVSPTLVTQTLRTLAACGSPLCVRPNVCVAGRTTANSITQISDLCFVNDEPGDCDSGGPDTVGAKCDATGTCRRADAGGECDIPDNCSSKQCWRPPGVSTGKGVCCSSVCNNDCETCVSGVCLPRNGELCARQPAVSVAEDLACDTLIKGWSGRQCQRYSGQRPRECDQRFCETLSTAPELCQAAAYQVGVGSTSHRRACTDDACKRSCTPLALASGVSQDDVCHRDTVIAGCTDIQCPNYMAGWSNQVCRKWSNVHPGFCEANPGANVFGRCSQNPVQCASNPSGAGREAHITCGNNNPNGYCNRDDRCQLNTEWSAAGLTSRSDVCKVNVAEFECDDIPCSAKIKGWGVGSATEQRRCYKYNNDHRGYCNNQANCDQNTARCENASEDNQIGRALVKECLSVNCRKTNECQINTDAPTNQAGRDNVCLYDVEESRCGDIPCQTVVKGWVDRGGANNEPCMVYNAPHPGWCLPDSSCDSSTDRCASEDVAATTVAFRCPSKACNRRDRCQPLSALVQNNEVGEVCHRNSRESRCPTPHSFPCTNFVTGWNGAQCMKYDRDIAGGDGHCDGTGRCIDQCSEVPNVREVEHLRCGSPGCRRLDTCQGGDNSNIYADISDICYVNKETSAAFNGGPTQCESGAICDETGTCVFADDGKACVEDDECGSKNCVFDDAGLGTCCNEPCTLECQFCARGDGQCKSRTGEACDVTNPIACDQLIKGFSISVANQCQRFSSERSGECLENGVCEKSTRLCEGRPGQSVQQCGSARCRRNDRCTPLDPVADHNELAEVCFVDQNLQECNDIPCQTLLAGWSSETGSEGVCLKYANAHTGRCDATASCATDTALCNDETIVAREEHLRCGDEACRLTTRCLPGAQALLFPALSDVCTVNAPDADCPELECSARLRGWENRSCKRYTIDRAGKCNGDAFCEQDPQACDGLPGATHTRCGDEACRRQCPPGELASSYPDNDDTCFVNSPVAECDDISCASFVKGWVGNQCHRYAQNHDGFCDGRSFCTQNVDVCVDSPGVVINANTECGSTACRREGGCVPGAPLSFASTRNAVCDTNKENDACDSVTCSTRIAGWQRNVCTKWSRDTAGYCDASGTCLTSDECARIPAQTRVEHEKCPSLGCVREDACVVGSDVANVNKGSLCYTDNQRHNCPVGAVCDTSGGCRFAPSGQQKADNAPCSAAGECASGFCVGGACCNAACTGECETCVDGQCVARVDEPCGEGACKRCDASGTCELKTTLCGEGLFGCDGAGRVCDGGTCKACPPPRQDPEKFVKEEVPPTPVPDCVEDVDCGGNEPNGRCVAGECRCDTGYTGQYCEEFVCEEPFNCNAAAGGGRCVDALTCECFPTFNPPNCLANCTAGCSGHGFCSAPDSCTCEPGYGGNDCGEVLALGGPCRTPADCREGNSTAVGSLQCWRAPGEDMPVNGTCCATACNGACNECSTGVCLPREGARCSPTLSPADALLEILAMNVSAQCHTCQDDPLSNNPAQPGKCLPVSSQCGVLSGSDDPFGGCTTNQFCFDGQCELCGAPVNDSDPGGMVIPPLECGTGPGQFKIDMRFANPKLPVVLCDNMQQVNVSVADGCEVAWMPGQGVGVDCLGVDGLITADDELDEALVLAFEPPLPGGAKLTLGLFTTTQDAGSAKVFFSDDVGSERRRQVEEEDVAFEDDEIELRYNNVERIELRATLGSFNLLEIDSIGFTVVMSDPTTTLGTTSPMMGNPNATVPTDDDTQMRALEPEIDNSLGARLSRAFAGEDNAVLGAFIGIVAFVVLCIVGCIVAGVCIVKKRKAQKKLYDAYGEGKPMQSFETVTAKPSTALGEDSDDEFGMSTTQPAGASGMAENGTMDDTPKVGITVEPLTDSDDDSF